MRSVNPISNTVKVLGLFFFIGLVIADGVFAFFLFRERLYPRNLFQNHKVFLPLALKIETANVEQQTTPTAVAPTPIPTPEETIYTVKSGDTLSQIARDFNVTVDDILKLNKIEDVNLIFPGEEIKIPGHPVQEDTPTVSPASTLYP
jgi:hypothetical protein